MERNFFNSIKNRIIFNANTSLMLTNANTDNINFYQYKLLKFSPALKFDEIFGPSSKLFLNEYPRLLTLIIGEGNLLSTSSLPETKITTKDINTALETISDFFNERSIILLFLFKKKQKLFYKDETSIKFIEVKEQEEPSEMTDFSTFFKTYKNKKILNFKAYLLEKLPNIENSTLILRFLRCLNLKPDFFTKLMIECARNGTVDDVIAATDGYLDENNEFCGHKLLNNKTDLPLVFQSAIQNQNKEVMDFLLSHLIQHLSFDHQVKISTNAFSSQQFKIFCHLIKIYDFPFPKNFDKILSSDELIIDEKVLEVVNERIEFYKNIEDEDSEKIKTFVDNNPTLKTAYSIKNESAIFKALNDVKYKTLFLLKSYGFKASEFESFEDKFDGVYANKEAVEVARMQRNLNVENSSSNENKAVFLLATRAVIFKRHNITRQKTEMEKVVEQQQRDKILTWYTEIYKTEFGSKILNAAAQCENLKIIFDFEYESIENVDVSTASFATGIVYPYRNWIFIGANLSDQKVKGVIAHEICHYVMEMVYENNSKPYYEHDTENCEKFSKIVEEIKEMLEIKQQVSMVETNKVLYKDDQCNGIIKVVYDLYNKEVHHPELIVRPVQIQAEYDNNPEKVEEIKNLYPNLFLFVENIMKFELVNFCSTQRENVRTFNNLTGLMAKCKKPKIKFSQNPLNDLTKHQVSIFQSNSPHIFLINVYKELYKIYDNRVDFENIFIQPKNLQNLYISKKFKELLKQDSNLNIIIDCSEEIENILKYFIDKKENLKFIILISNEQDKEQVLKTFKNYKSIEYQTQQYEWADFVQETQLYLLNLKFYFQNDKICSLAELIGIKPEELQMFDEFCKIITKIEDNELLNMLGSKSAISINEQIKQDIDDNYLRLLFVPRNFNAITFEQFLILDNVSTLYTHKQITTEEMLDNIEDLKYVLISDIAGMGKSWILKSFALKLLKKFPMNWITYVDLKLYIKDLMDSTKNDLEFSNFFAENILKPHHKFEAEIFKQLYKNGKVFIFFDGFDEIAPDCAEFVTNLAKSFESNNGNQLWIATRDYFEDNLKKELKINTVYKLTEFTEDQAVDYIASSWALNAINYNLNYLSLDDFNNKFKKSEQFIKSKEMARKITEKIKKSQKFLMGSAQFYKMIAKVAQNDTFKLVDTSMTDLFNQFIYLCYKRWSQQKGKIRNDASALMQVVNLGYNDIHQLIAMKSIFRNGNNFCDLNFKDLEAWKPEDIIACDLLNKIGNGYYFTHETFREFYVAQFILRFLNKSEKLTNCKVAFFLIPILFTEQYKNIRMFLNDKIMQTQSIDHVKYIHEMFSFHIGYFENIDLISQERLFNLSDFLIKIMLNFDSITLVALFKMDGFLRFSIYAAEYSEVFKSYKEIFFYKLDDCSLKSFITLFPIILFKFFTSANDRDLTIQFLDDFDKKVSPTFTKEVILIKKFNKKCFTLCDLGISKSENRQDISMIFEEILHRYLENDEIINLIELTNENFENVLQVCLSEGDAINLECIWTEIKNLYEPEHFQLYMMEIINQNASKRSKNLVHYLRNCTKIEFHEMFWELILKTFENQDDLKSLILQTDEFKNNLFHGIIIFNKPEIVEFTFERIVEFDGWHEILMSNSLSGRNSLQLCIQSIEIKICIILINILNNFSNLTDDSEESLEIIGCENDPISHILECIIVELESMITPEEIKNIITLFGFYFYNIFTFVAQHNNSIEFYQCLWKILRKYFNFSIIINSIKLNKNAEIQKISAAMKRKPQNVIDFIQNELKKYFENCVDCEQINNYSNYLKNTEKYSPKNEILLKFSEIFNHLDANLQIENVIYIECSSKFLIILHKMALNFNIKKHKILWQKMIKIYKNTNELKDLLLQKKFQQLNYIHLLIINDNHNALKVALKYLKRSLPDEDYEQILRMKDFTGKNLLHFSVIKSKNIKIHKILLHFFVIFFSDEENYIKFLQQRNRQKNEIFDFDFSNFIKFLQERDNLKNEIFHDAVTYASDDVFKTMLSKFCEIFDSSKMKICLLVWGHENQTILQTAVNCCTSLDVYKELWEGIEKYFNPFEICKFVRKIKMNFSLYNILNYDKIEIYNLTNEKIKYYKGFKGLKGWVKVKTIVLQKRTREMLKSVDCQREAETSC